MAGPNIQDLNDALLVIADLWDDIESYRTVSGYEAYRADAKKPDGTYGPHLPFKKYLKFLRNK